MFNILFIRLQGGTKEPWMQCDFPKTTPGRTQFLSSKLSTHHFPSHLQAKPHISTKPQLLPARKQTNKQDYLENPMVLEQSKSSPRTLVESI